MDTNKGCDCEHCAEVPEVDNRDTIVQYFPCPDCAGHGAKVIRRKENQTEAVLCGRCWGSGQLGATADQIEEAACIGSDNPFCTHDWSFTGVAYGGDEESYHGEGRCYCSRCGADGDA